MKRQNRTMRKVLALLLAVFMLVSDFAQFGSKVVYAGEKEIETSSQETAGEGQAAETASSETSETKNTDTSPSAQKTTETAVTEAPKAEAPETAATEAPKAEAPETAATEASKAETPEAAATEEPKEEAPETAAAEAATEAAATEAPETAATETPAAGAPETSTEAEPSEAAKAETAGTEDEPEEKSLIETEISEKGFAYVTTKEEITFVYEEIQPTEKKLGEIREKNALLCASEYIRRQSDETYVRVWFDTAEGKVQGYVSENALNLRPVEQEQAVQRIAAENETLDAWQDDAMTRPLRETSYVPETPSDLTQDGETAVCEESEMAEADTLLAAEEEQPEKDVEEVPEEPTTKDITVRLQWDESGSEFANENYRPGWVLVSLYRDGIFYKDVCLYKSEFSGQATWEKTAFAGVPIKDPTGNLYEYEVKVEIANLGSVYTLEDFGESEENPGLWEGKCVFREKTTVRATVKWSDDNDSNKLRPQTLSDNNLVLTYTKWGEQEYTPSTLTKNEDGTWTAVFEEIPTTYGVNPAMCGDYTISLKDISGYTSSSSRSSLTGEYTVTCSLCTYNVRIGAYMSTSIQYGTTSSWNAVEALGIDIPESITVTLTNNGIPVNRSDAVQTMSRNADGSWSDFSHTWYLPYYDTEGNPIDYSGLSIAYTPDKEKGELPGQYQQTLEKQEYVGSVHFKLSTSVPVVERYYVQVEWDDIEDFFGMRPSDATMTLLADGQPVKYQEKVILPDSDKTVYIMSWLLKYDQEGKPVHYTIQIDGLPDYFEVESSQSPEYSETEGYGVSTSLIIIDTLNITLKDYQKVEAEVQWLIEGEGSDTELENRPDTVNLTLEYTTDDPEDGAAQWQEYWGRNPYAVSQGEDGSWKYEWTLPLTDTEGMPVNFRVREENLSLYTTNYSDSVVTTDENGKKIPLIR